MALEQLLSGVDAELIVLVDMAGKGQHVGGGRWGVGGAVHWGLCAGALHRLLLLAAARGAPGSSTHGGQQGMHPVGPWLRC
jgi:hypothetical protein